MTPADDLLADLPDAEPLESILRPEWANAQKCHDWRNHIPKPIRRAWPSLSEDARIVAYVLAEQSADAETWD